MGMYLWRRCPLFIPSVVGMSTISFVLMRLIPCCIAQLHMNTTSSLLESAIVNLNDQEESNWT